MFLSKFCLFVIYYISRLSRDLSLDCQKPWYFSPKFWHNMITGILQWQTTLSLIHIMPSIIYNSIITLVPVLVQAVSMSASATVISHVSLTDCAVCSATEIDAQLANKFNLIKQGWTTTFFSNCQTNLNLFWGWSFFRVYLRIFWDYQLNPRMFRCSAV